MEFQVFHRYNELAEQGHCKALLCRHCDSPLAVVMGPKDEPALRCFNCNVLTLPGLNMYSSMRAVVKEWTE